MPQTDILMTCANWGRPVRESEAKDAGWRHWSDGVGEFHSFFPGCAAREFSRDAPASAFGEPQREEPEVLPVPTLEEGWVFYYCGEPPTWKLDCGHEIPLLEHERPEDPPRPPRMCPVCETLRNVTPTPSGLAH